MLAQHRHLTISGISLHMSCGHFYSIHPCAAKILHGHTNILYSTFVSVVWPGGVHPSAASRAASASYCAQPSALVPHADSGDLRNHWTDTIQRQIRPLCEKAGYWAKAPTRRRGRPVSGYQLLSQGSCLPYPLHSGNDVSTHLYYFSSLRICTAGYAL